MPEVDAVRDETEPHERRDAERPPKDMVARLRAPGDHEHRQQRDERVASLVEPVGRVGHRDDEHCERHRRKSRRRVEQAAAVRVHAYDAGGESTEGAAQEQHVRTGISAVVDPARVMAGVVSDDHERDGDRRDHQAPRHEQHEQQRREQAARPPYPKGSERDPTAPLALGDEQTCDEEAAEHEEDVDTEETAREGLGREMQRHYGKDRDSADAVERAQVRHPRRVSPEATGLDRRPTARIVGFLPHRCPDVHAAPRTREPDRLGRKSPEPVPDSARAREYNGEFSGLEHA